MGKRFGISITEDGMFVEATVLTTRRSCTLTKVRRWNNHSFLRNYLLLSRAESLGMPATWIRKLPGGTTGLVAGNLPDSFVACTSETEYNHYTEMLRNNVTAVYPDDAFLITIPRFFAPDAPDTFISVAAAADNVRIGIIRKNTLVSVFHVRASSVSELDGHIGRIERYLRIEDPASPNFETRYLLYGFDGYDPASDTMTQISCGSDDLAVIKAVGCTLCGELKDAVPQLGGASIASRFRHLRSVVLAAAATTIVISVLCIAALYGYTTKCTYKIAEAKRSYQHILSNNTEIRSLVAEGDSVAKKLVRVNQRLSHPSNWGAFLQQLGTLRPSGLFIERLGSEPADKPSKARIVLAGWCETETTATDFIKVLKKSPLLSGVTLSSIDRIGEQTTKCRFKIVCVLSISNQ